MPAAIASTERPRGADAARAALVDAAARLLPHRAPSAITGRDLAREAGVNYGLVHHYFGGKDAVLEAGLAALREDLAVRHPDTADLPLLGIDAHPYLQALVRWHVDAPESTAAGGDFPLSSALVEAIRGRLAVDGIEREASDLDAEAKARAIAAIAVQVCFSVFGEALLDATGVGHRQRRAVQTQLAAVHRGIVAH